MQIECTQCEMYRTVHCDDCLVSVLLHPPDGVVEVDDELDPGLQALSGAGLIPVLRFRPREPVPEDPPAGEIAEAAETG
jgi:hypothetical protein